MATTTLRCRTLHAPKDGNRDDEYEDAFAPPDGPPDGAERFTAVVADGASSSVFARQWARLLADDFAREPFGDEATARERIAGLGRAWHQQVGGLSSSWYAQEKLAQGSHASLLVVTWDLAAGSWAAHAVGDCCLFLVRDARLATAFPRTRADAFDNRPDLVSTEGSASPPTFLSHAGTVAPGDRFLLMSDALAAWFLAEAERKRKPWDAFPPTPDDFAPWLAHERERGALKNDDVTLVTVTVA